MLVLILMGNGVCSYIKPVQSLTIHCPQVRGLLSDGPECIITVYKVLIFKETEDSQDRSYQEYVHHSVHVSLLSMTINFISSVSRAAETGRVGGRG